MAKHTALIILSLVFCAGCLAQTEADPAPQPPAAACAPVKCEFKQGQCNAADGMTFAGTTWFDDGKGCWFRTAACFPTGTPAECIPADCYEETGFGCAAP